METPSLKEVKKHFKNAKEIKALYPNEVFNISDIEFNFNDFGEDIWLRGLSDIGRNIKLWSKQQGYAKILSYKEKTYSITESQIKELGQLSSLISTEPIKDKLKELFPDVLKTELVTGKWYKMSENGKFMFCFNGKFGNMTQFGFDCIGRWSDRELGVHETDNYKETTEQEVTEALIKEVFKRYTGKYVKPLNEDIMSGYDKKGIILKFENIHLDSDNRLWCTAGKWQCIIFNNGKWAEILETITKEEAEKQLNKKIV